MLYNTSSLQLTENLWKETNNLKKEFNIILLSKQLDKVEGQKIKQYSDEVYYTYLQLKYNIISNNAYTFRFSANSKVNMLYRMQSFVNYLQINSSNKNTLETIRILSNMCTDIDIMYKNYNNNSIDIVKLNNKLTLNEGWVDILNNFDKIFEKYYEKTKNTPGIYLQL
jgi:hypothetical protein